MFPLLCAPKIYTPLDLYEASIIGDVKTVKGCIEQFRAEGILDDALNKYGYCGRNDTPLFRAIVDSQYLVAIELLKAGAKPMLTDIKGATPIITSLQCASDSMTRLLLWFDTDYSEVKNWRKVTLIQLIEQTEKKRPGSMDFFIKAIACVYEIQDLKKQASKAEIVEDFLNAADYYFKIASIYQQYDKMERKAGNICRLDYQPIIADYYKDLANTYFQRANDLYLKLEEDYKSKLLLNKEQRLQYAEVLERLADIAMYLGKDDTLVKLYSKMSAEMRIDPLPKMSVLKKPEAQTEITINPLTKSATLVSGLRHRKQLTDNTAPSTCI